MAGLFGHKPSGMQGQEGLVVCCSSTRSKWADVSEHCQKGTKEVDALSPQKEEGR